MKKNIFLHLTIATFFLGLSACTDDNLLPPVENNVPTIDAGLLEDYYFILDTDIPQTHMPQTRVSYINERESYFDEGDEMGIFVINENNELISSANGNATTANVRYKVTNVTNIADNSVRQVIEPVNGPSNRVPRGHRYIIYYPYRANMDFNLITGLTYTVEANQNANETTKTDLQNQGLTAFEASDLLWDVAVDESIEGSDGEKVNYANVKMEHIMAQIILRINDDAVTSETPVNIVNCPLRATGINLSTAALEELQYSSSASTTTGIIRMWYSGLSSSGASQFRAVVPACRTLEAGTALFQINDKTYKISKVLNLQPGKNYIFSIGESGNIEQPELSDDDSWVYDVLDPQTGTPVGLLCREYLRYQASNDKDEMTGTDNGQGSKWINSQAWVFYNLQDDGRTPDLNQGTVLRFIYDIEEIGHGATPVNGTAQANIWPAPHYKMTSGGLFTPLHGYKWGTMYANGYGGEYTGMGTAQDGYDEPIETQYYMHGGVITWDGTNNKIANFTLPDAKITNNEALQGYIAIEDGQKPYIAYQEKEGVRKGIIVEHFLIDTRRTKLNNRQTEIKRYPLVKIGYNQFWMSKPLDTEYMTDGTPIPCYNSTEGPKVTFSTGTEGVNEGIGLGYLYCFVNNDTNNPGITYDPYNNKEDRPDPTKTSFTPGKYYNFNTVEDARFLPISPESNTFYTMPDRNDITYLGEYFGPWFAAKISSRNIGPYQKANEGAGEIEFLTGYTRKQSIIEGKTCGLINRAANVFCANISGFNLYSVGFYDVAHDEKGLSFRLVGESSCIILKREAGENRVTMMDYRVYDTFNEDNPVNDETLIFHEYNHNSLVDYAPLRPSKIFGQVRLFMKYRNQADTGGASASFQTRSASPQQPESRNVYVPLEVVE